MSQKELQVIQAIEDDLFTFAEYDPQAAERVGYSDYSYWGSTLKIFFKNKTVIFFLVLMASLILLQPSSRTYRVKSRLPRFTPIRSPAALFRTKSPVANSGLEPT